MNPDQMDREIKSILSHKKDDIPTRVAKEIDHTLHNLPTKKSLREKIKNRFFMQQGLGIAVLAILLIFMAGFASQHIWTLVNDEGEEILRIQEFNSDNEKPDYIGVMQEVRKRMELGDVKHILINKGSEEIIRTVTKPKHYGSLMQLKSHVDFLVRTPAYTPEGYEFAYGTLTKQFDIDHQALMERFNSVSSEKNEVIVIDGESKGIPDGLHLNYENANKEVIRLRQWNNGPSNIYVSDLKEWEGSKHDVNGMQAIYRETDSYQEVIWKDGLSLHEIYTTVLSMDKKELIKLANSLYQK